MECSSLCPTENYIITSSNFQSENLYSRIKNDKELELNFYSSKEKFLFQIDFSYFSGQKVAFKNLINSKTIQLKFKQGSQFSTKSIEVNPGFQFFLPEIKPSISNDDFQRNFNGLKPSKSNDDYSINSSDLKPSILNSDFQKDFNELKSSKSKDNFQHNLNGFKPSKINNEFQNNLNDLKHLKFYNDFQNNFDKIEKYDRSMLTKSIDPFFYAVPISVGLAQFKHSSGIACDPQNIQFDIDHINDINCPTDDLELPAAYQCGFRCWTAETQTSYEYTFKGVKFALYGTYAENHGTFYLIIDDKNPIQIDEKGPRAEYAFLYMSDDLEYKEHTIYIFSRKIYELHKLTYWPSLQARRLNSTEFVKTMEWTKETDGIGGVKELTNEEGATATATIIGSKIWVYGTKKNTHGDLTIKYNDHEETINEYSESTIEGALLYESEDMEFGNHELVLSSPNADITSIYCVYYFYNPVTQTPEPFPTISSTPNPTPLATPVPIPIPISVGLAQMISTGGANCEPSGDLDIKNIDKIGCEYKYLETEYAYQCGFRCYGRTMNFEYTFKGVKFDIYGTLDPTHGKFDVVIDDGNPIEVDERRDSRKVFTSIYTSDELEYGEHNVKINSRGDIYELYKLTYWPSMKANRINISQFQKTGKWTIQTDGIGGAREYTESNFAVAEINVSCSKLWIYGTTTRSYKNFLIRINDFEEEIKPQSNERIDAALLYESPNFKYDLHNLFIYAPSYPISIYAIYYIDDYPLLTSTPDPTFSPIETPTPSESPSSSQSPEQTETPYPTFTVSQSPEPSFTPEPTEIPLNTPIPISVGLTQMEHEGRVYCNVAYFGIENIQNLGCSIDNLETESAYKCGYKCWSYGETNFSYTFIGVKFSIYGTFDPNHQRFNLTIDKQPPIEINEYRESRSEYVVIYTSEEMKYGKHTVKINGIGEVYELYKLVYWPQNNVKRFNSSDLAKTGTWRKESDGIGGIREYTESKGNTAEITFFCTKVWIFTTVCGWHDNLYIYFNDHNYNISLHSQERKDGYLIFESDELPYGEYTLTFTSGGTVTIYCIYYQGDPPDATKTPFPSRTAFPVTRLTYIDQVFNNYILHDQIGVTSESSINQISGCRFIQILEDIDYLIRIEKEIPFYDNSFEYDINQVNPCSPIINNLRGDFHIVKCTFINSKCRVQGGNVFTSPLGYSINLFIESSIFINCGDSTNKAIIKVLNYNSKINMKNCSISFEDELTSSKVLDVSASYVSIDECTFHKSGTIQIDSEISSLSFEFTNNAISSIYQQFINAKTFTEVPLITNNVFKDIQVTNSSLINIIHSLDEIEIKNNTFENVIFEEKEDYDNNALLYYQKIEDSCLTFILNNCHFISNENRRVAESSFSNGGSIQYGFSKLYINATVQFLNCVFKHNKCLNGKGGALALNVINDVIISYCLFEDNYAAEEGSSIYVDGNVTTEIQMNLISINNCQFKGNKGINCIYIYEKIDTFEVDSCNFIDNQCDINQPYIIQSFSSYINFNNNSIYFSASNENKFGSLDLNYSKTADISNSEFINCQLAKDASLLFSGTDDEVFTNVSNCTFVDCVARRYTVSIEGGNSDVKNCTFSFSAKRNACSGLEILSPKTLTISESKFINNNNRLLNGGSLYIHDSTDKSPEKLTINGISFSSCLGSSYRTICVNFKSIQEELFVIENFEIRDISTGASLYGIYVDKNVLFSHCSFLSNLFGNELGGGYGSYYLPRQHISFEDCIWNNNYCSDNGGAFGGVIKNVGSSLFILESLTFKNCQFTSNSCLGNGGALYLDMALDTAIVTITNSTFEMNKASNDCGAIFARNKDVLTIDSCTFLNNSATKVMMSTIDPTDALFVNGCSSVIINNTIFIKGSYFNEKTNYQFSHVNTFSNKRDFSITIRYSMFSIINPTSNQLFAQEIQDIGSYYIYQSSFTHFVTRNPEISSSILLNDKEIQGKKKDKNEYNHLFRELNAPVHIVECCFDNNEYIIFSNQNKAISLLESTFTSNTINGQCSYPKVVDQMFIDIGTYENLTYKIPEENPKNYKTLLIIVFVAVAVVVIVAVVLTIVLVRRHKNKKNQNIDSENEDNEDNEINERNFQNFATKMVTQENPLYSKTKQTRLSSSDSSSPGFEESRWNDDFI